MTLAGLSRPLRPSPWDVAANRLDPAVDWSQDPIGWLRDTLGEHVWSKQREIAESVRDHRYTAVHSCHDSGKSFIASRIAAWWIESHAPGEAFVVTTAPSHPQVKAILWREMNRAHKRGRLIGHMNQLEWWIGNEMVAMGRKPAEYNAEAFQGIHQRYVLVVIDEACGVPKSLWDAADTLATNEFSRVLAIGNPDDPSAMFAENCKPGSGWNVIGISAFETPNFTGEWVPAGLTHDLVSKVWVEERKKRWGSDSPLYVSKVLGQFPEYAMDTVVPFPLIGRHRRQEGITIQVHDLPVELGVDVGAGGDETVIRERRGSEPGRVWKDHTANPDAVVGKMVKAIKATGAKRVKIDTIGIGWGVAGWLEDQIRDAEEALKRLGPNPTQKELDEVPFAFLAGVEVVRVNVAEQSSDPERWPNLRSELWWSAREWTQEGSWDLRELDDDTLAQLVAPKYSVDSRGRTVVEKKEEVRERIGRSPDDADALLMAFYRPPVTFWSAV